MKLRDVLHEARTLACNEEYAQAESLLKSACDKWPDNIVPRRVLGEVYSMQDDLQRSIEYRTSVAQAFPQNATAWIDLCRELLLVNRFRTLKIRLDEALEQVPGDRRLELMRKWLKRSIRLTQEKNFNRNIGLHLETMPRSGTHYTINRIRRHKRYGYATVFYNEVPDSPIFQQGVVMNRGVYHQVPVREEYLLKSHFFRTVDSSWLFTKDYLKVKLVTHPLDCLYSWAHLIHRRTGSQVKYDGYVVRFNSDEWRSIRRHMPCFVRWAKALEEDTVLRYEDYGNLESPSIKRLAAHVGAEPDQLFTDFRPDGRRIFFGAAPESRFDSKVLADTAELVRAMERFYPGA